MNAEVCGQIGGREEDASVTENLGVSMFCLLFYTTQELVTKVLLHTLRLGMYVHRITVLYKTNFEFRRERTGTTNCMLKENGPRTY